MSISLLRSTFLNILVIAIIYLCEFGLATLKCVWDSIYYKINLALGYIQNIFYHGEKKTREKKKRRSALKRTISY